MYLLITLLTLRKKMLKALKDEKKKVQLNGKKIKKEYKNRNYCVIIIIKVSSKTGKSIENTSKMNTRHFDFSH